MGLQGPISNIPSHSGNVYSGRTDTVKHGRKH